MAIDFSLANFLQFMEDLPFASIGTAAASGGLDIPLDFATAQAIAAAAVKDFYTGAPASAAAAPHTTAAVTAATSN
jgi:hypothetical protein